MAARTASLPSTRTWTETVSPRPSDRAKPRGISSVGGGGARVEGSAGVAIRDALGKRPLEKNAAAKARLSALMVQVAHEEGHVVDVQADRPAEHGEEEEGHGEEGAEGAGIAEDVADTPCAPGRRRGRS